MITLINTNRMSPPIAPIGLDYLAGAARSAGIEVEVLDLGLAGDPPGAMREYFSSRRPELVGLSFRNVDDSFWPSAAWFVPPLRDIVAAVRALTDAPVVLGGAGFSIFPERIIQETKADFGVRGDGEQAMVRLVEELRGRRRFEQVPGLLWRAEGRTVVNEWAAEPTMPKVHAARDAIDNATYFRLGGQMGVQTKRGCNRGCIFCADQLASGSVLRLRPPRDVADEVEALHRRGIDVLHLCDGEFNVPRSGAMAVCEEMHRRGLGEKVRWYTYMAVIPFEADLAEAMRRAGCVGINFTAPAASEAMLCAYRQPHTQEELAEAVRLCREHRITVMLDVMFGGPGETPQTVAEAIAFLKGIAPDCVGAGLGVRLYPGLEMTRIVEAEAPLHLNPGVVRRYEGPIDLLQPTYYVSPALGSAPAALIREAIAGDARFFEPCDAPSADDQTRGYNYNDNDPLVRAIAAGARGAYWDILRRSRGA